MLAAKMFRENLPVPEKDTNGNVGARLHRVDAEEKALGTGKYADDIPYGWHDLRKSVAF